VSSKSAAISLTPPAGQAVNVLCALQMWHVGTTVLGYIGYPQIAKLMSNRHALVPILWWTSAKSRRIKVSYRYILMLELLLNSKVLSCLSDLYRPSGTIQPSQIGARCDATFCRYRTQHAQLSSFSLVKSAWTMRLRGS
jgi:hypothetical protein